MVSIPESMAADGLRRRKFFPKKITAEKFAAGLRKDYHAGVRGCAISLSLAQQAGEAERILEGSGISIVEAARMAAAKVDGTESRETFGDRYARAVLWGEAHWSRRYASDMEKLPRWCAALWDRPCGALDRPQVEEALQVAGKLSCSTLDMRAARVLSVIGFREKHRKNPVIHILTAGQRSAVLDACETPEERRAVALLLYAGIRPSAQDGEISRLDWHDVGKLEIYVSQDVSKTGRDRHIPICPALRVEIEGHPESGPVAPPNWKPRWQRIRKTAGIGKMQDVLRHTFASHYLAAYGEEATKQAMGHTAGSTTLFRHYRRAVTAEDGKAFFAGDSLLSGLEVHRIARPERTG